MGVTAAAGDDRPPSVDRLARHLAETSGTAGAGVVLPAPLLVDVARSAIVEADAAGDPSSAWARAEAGLAGEQRRHLQPVINATGVLLHTNLGRAPINVDRPAGYSNLELDLISGRRGSRSAHAARLLARACGAEAALVVNNGAAALLLVLTTLAAGREVVVSRGELVEIGGGFRIPEVLAASGARLVEVGTTNRTRPSDYQAAVGPQTAALLKVHTSNYRISGFTRSVTVAQLAELAELAEPANVIAAADHPTPAERAADGLPVVADLGSGLLDANCPWLRGGPPSWLAGEPAVRQTLGAGAALVTFSGDKLLGGPQAGVIAGRSLLVERCARHPLARALRPGGLVLAVLQDVALAYLRRDAGDYLPLWRMATTPVDELRARARALRYGKVIDCASVMGGGSLPGRTIPSAGIAIDGDVTGALRSSTPPVLARAVEGSTVCDLRTVPPTMDGLLAKGLAPCG
jgi:L-seryl-tRNA(Ser) seleniumtransferase